jgi:hypothetical protein
MTAKACRRLVPYLVVALAWVSVAVGAIAASETAFADSDPWRGRTLDVVPLLAGAESPQLILAQRAITRDVGKKATDSMGPEPEYGYVDVPGWISPGKASALSMALPGAGQLYAGSNRGFVFLGVEAVAVLAYVKYRNDSHGKRDQYFSFVGDPNQPSSRFAFERLAATVSAEELAHLQEIYARDPREFYDLVSTNDAYAGGWTDATGERSTAQAYIDEVNSLGRKSKVGLIAAITNHLVSTVDALHLARISNLALRENLSLKLKIRPGAHQSYGFTLTQKF